LNGLGVDIRLGLLAWQQHHSQANQNNPELAPLSRNLSQRSKIAVAASKADVCPSTPQRPSCNPEEHWSCFRKGLFLFHHERFSSTPSTKSTFTKSDFSGAIGFAESW
jgi:hypothetical protein